MALLANIANFRVHFLQLLLFLHVLLATGLLPLCRSSETGFSLAGVMELRSYNPVKGTEYHQYRESVVFKVLRAADQWQIFATNLFRPRYWAILNWDGSNTCVLRPPYVPADEKQEPTNELWGTVYSGCPWGLDTDDPTHTSFIRLTYCFAPGEIVPDRQGRRVAPTHVARRDNTLRYGYRWEYTPSPDGRFVDFLRIVRDRSLDVPVREELLRREFDPPQTLEEFNTFKEYLAIRRTIADGFVKEEFKCQQRLATNGWHLPLRAEFIRYSWPYAGKVARKVTLHTTNVATGIPRLDSPPRPTLPTRVRDYRYRRFENDRLFLRATYMLQPGEPWRGPNDPELLAQAEEYIRNGPRYDAFLRPQMRHYLTWLAYAGLVIVPLAAYALRRRLPRGTPPRT